MSIKPSGTNNDAIVQDFTLGLALSGGGSRGFAHAGALQAIDEAGIRVDVIAGVSAGSVVAVLYAAGVKPRRILEMFSEARFIDLVDFTIGNGGFLRIEPFTHYVTRALGQYKRLEQLKIPTYIGVTNFDDGTPEVFSAGEIGPIIQASCSIPIAIMPISIDGTTYVDGGVLRNLPAWTIRDKCEKLLGINVSPVLPKKKYYNSVMAMALRSYTLLAKSNQAQDMALCDAILTMDDISHHKTFSLKHITSIYHAGYEKMKALIDSGVLFGKNPE